jgi:hypothetical protein
VACGIIVGIGIDRGGWQRGVLPVVSAQQGRRNALPTMESLPAEVAQLKALVPSNSHIMMGVRLGLGTSNGTSSCTITSANPTAGAGATAQITVTENPEAIVCRSPTSAT